MRGHMRRRGEAWELRAFAGRDPVTASKKYVTRTFRGSQRDAETELSKLVAQASAGGDAAQDTTLGELLDRWFAMAKADLSPSTAREYERLITLQIKPILGSVRLARLKASHLDSLYMKLRKKGGRNGAPLSPASVRQVHAVIRRALSQGVRWGWITVNPAANATPPKIRRTDIVPPEPPEVMALIRHAEAIDDDLGCFLRVSATTGARRGELCALRWSDVDLEHHSLTIVRSVVNDGHGGVLLKDTKTHASRRLALDRATSAALVVHRERMAHRAEQCGVRLAEDAFVFSRSPAGDTPVPPDEVTRVFVSCRKALGLPHVRLHDLRHFAATRLLAAGVPVRTVSGRLGHANAATTLSVYGHFLEVSDRQAADVLGALLSSGAGNELDQPLGGDDDASAEAK